jgi:aldose 1-epimerase
MLAVTNGDSHMDQPRRRIATCLLAGSVAAGAAFATDTPMKSAGAAPQVFGHMPDGAAVPLYTLRNAHGIEIGIIPWGATVVSIKVPDRHGKQGDIVLGFDSLDGYRGQHPYFGAVVGRYGNRIAKGRFTLDGHAYVLPVNNGENHLHGGPAGFDKKLWQARALPGGHGVELQYTSADGEQGYPGALTATVTYTLSDANELRIDYLATTDRPTVVNLTNHSYFNLAGRGDVLGHRVQIEARNYTPVDAGLIPTGKIASVSGTPFDFTAPHAIGERIDQNDEQLRFGLGYDHNWVLDAAAGKLHLAARVTEPSSGRVLEVLTTEPGLQFYTGNFLDGTIHGKGGQAYARRAAFCMETQHFPDSPNHPQFPGTTLRPGQRYQSTTVYRFSASK